MRFRTPATFGSKLTPSKLLDWNWTTVYLALTLFSIGGYSLADNLHLSAGPVAPVSAAASLLAGLLATYRWFWPLGRPAWLATGTILLLGTGSEILSLRSGWPFGTYQYTQVWQPVLDLKGIGLFPLLLPAAWLMVVGASALACQSIKSLLLACFASAAIATTLDLAMEATLAGKLGYWHWQGPGPLPGGAPLSNSVTWFVLSGIGSWTVLGVVRNQGASIAQRDSAGSVQASILVLAGQFLLMGALRFA